MEFSDRTMFKNHLSIYTKMRLFSNLDVNSFKKQITCCMCLQIWNYLPGPVVSRGDINSSDAYRPVSTHCTGYLVYLWCKWHHWSWFYDRIKITCPTGKLLGKWSHWSVLLTRWGTRGTQEEIEWVIWVKMAPKTNGVWGLQNKPKANQKPPFSSLLPSFHPHR